MNMTLLFSIIVLMLLGAFILGIIIGSLYFTKQVPQESIQKNNEDNEIYAKNKHKSSSVQNNPNDTLDLQDYEPGVRIKARLARDRAGSLPQESNFEKDTTTLDFNRIGKADKKNPDDLELIEGIGPHFAKKLNEIGVYHFRQLVAMNDQDLKIIAPQIGFFFNRIKRENWQSQARDLIEKEN